MIKRLALLYKSLMRRYGDQGNRKKEKKEKPKRNASLKPVKKTQFAP